MSELIKMQKLETENRILHEKLTQLQYKVALSQTPKQHSHTPVGVPNQTSYKVQLEGKSDFKLMRDLLKQQIKSPENHN